MKTHQNPLPPTELQILQYLHPRMNLPENERQKYQRLNKGNVGEQRFHELIENGLPTNDILLSNLLLQSNNTMFQIDSLLIRNQPIYHFEVKNYEGDYYIKEENWYIASSGKEIRNPILQLKRTEFLLRHLLQELGYNNIPIKSYIVFINQEFTLYQAPLNLPIILPTQLKRFIKNMHHANPYTITDKQKNLANQLLANTMEKSSYEQIPKYSYSQLKKGIVCKSCANFLTPTNRKQLRCSRCDSLEDIDSAVMRNVLEFSLLFPDKKITKASIHEWCRVIDSKKVIRRILSNNLTLINQGRYSYYVFQNERDTHRVENQLL